MIGIIVQARGRSIHFPNKIYTKLNGKAVLQRTLEGVCESRMAHKVILAMGDEDRADIKAGIERGDYSRAVSHRGFSVYCGESEDVLQRFYDAAGINGLDLIVRVKGDCPFVQANVIDDMLDYYLREGFNGFMYNSVLEDKCDNIKVGSFLDSPGVSIFPWWLLVDAHKNSKERVGFDKYMNNRTRNSVYSYLGNDWDFKFDLDDRSEVEHLNRLAMEYDKDRNLLASIYRMKNE